MWNNFCQNLLISSERAYKISSLGYFLSFGFFQMTSSTKACTKGQNGRRLMCIGSLGSNKHLGYKGLNGMCLLVDPSVCLLAY